MIEIELLGTGTSSGVPLIGCECETCTSTDPHDARLRTSALVRANGTNILIDTSPDLRQQMLRCDNRQIDAVLITHPHADHTAGMDELRRYNGLMQKRIPMFAPDNAVHELRQRFGYCFTYVYDIYGYKPDLDLHAIAGTPPISVAGIPVQPIPILHGTMPILGYRIGNLAYLTDVKWIPDESWDLLQGLDTLILTALRRFEHPAHMMLDEALDAIDRLRPRRAVLTHIAHEMGRAAEIQPLLPSNVELGYDGMVIRVEF